MTDPLRAAIEKQRKYNRAYKAAQRARRRLNGQCIQCGADGGGLSLCRACYVRQRERDKRRAARVNPPKRAPRAEPQIDHLPAIRDAIKAQRLAIAETARRAEVPRTTLSAYLAGRRGLSTANVARLLAALGITLKAGKPPKPPAG